METTVLHKGRVDYLAKGVGNVSICLRYVLVRHTYLSSIPAGTSMHANRVTLGHLFFERAYVVLFGFL